MLGPATSSRFKGSAGRTYRASQVVTRGALVTPRSFYFRSTVENLAAGGGAQSDIADSEQVYEVEAGDLAFDAKPMDLQRRLRRIYDNARTTIEERGITTLYLTFGVPRWKDVAHGESIAPSSSNRVQEPRPGGEKGKRSRA